MPSRQRHVSVRGNSTARSVGDCAPVANLRKRVRALTLLDQRLRQSLPSPLREQVRLADLRGGRMAFLAPTPALAARLRMCTDDLLDTAQKLGAHAVSVVVKVVPTRTDATQPVSAKTLPRTTADHLRKAARSLSDHELRALFLELASLAGDHPSPSEPQ